MHKIMVNFLRAWELSLLDKLKLGAMVGEMGEFGNGRVTGSQEIIEYEASLK